MLHINEEKYLSDLKNPANLWKGPMRLEQANLVLLVQMMRGWVRWGVVNL